MHRVLKWAGIGLGGLVGLLAVVAFGLWVAGGSRLNRHYDVQPPALTVPDGDSAVARGRHLAEAITLCNGCHGDALDGKLVFEAPMIARVHASNLTTGAGGVGNLYSNGDYARAIRHGVNRDGRGMMIMHSDAYNRLTEADLGALIAYIRSLPPVDNRGPGTRAGALGRILVALGVFDQGDMPLIPAEVIDHAAPFPTPTRPGATVEYGRYLVSIALCSMCHGSDLRGGPPFEEGAPPAPTLTVYGVANGWTEEQFIAAIRAGVAPSGRPLDPEAMPWEVYARMTDAELAAIRAYIVSLAGR